MVIPDTFGRRGVRAITTYEFADIAEGTGIIDFYLAQSQENLTISPVIVQRLGMSSTEDGREKDIDNNTVNFDLAPFNLPKTVIGTSYFQFEASSTNSAAVMTFQLKKDSGGAVTNIGTAVAIQLDNGTDKYLIKYPITTKIHFKKGDFLRLEIVGNNQGAFFIGTDPANETGVNVLNTRTTLSIPFDLDI